MANKSLLSSRLAAISLLCTRAMGALVSVPNFGSNPTNLQMNIYVPSNVAASPAVILAVRNCSVQAGSQYLTFSSFIPVEETARSIYKWQIITLPPTNTASSQSIQALLTTTIAGMLPAPALLHTKVVAILRVSQI